MNINHTKKFPLWNNRESLPSFKVLPAIVLIVMLTALSALAAIGFGGMLLMGISGALFGVFLVGRRDFLPWLSLLTCFGASFAASGSLAASLASLLFVPIGIILAVAAFTQSKLFPTCAALSAILLISMAAYLAIAAAQIYEGTLRQCLSQLYAEIDSTLRQAFELFSYKGADGEIYHLAKGDIDLLIEGAVMILPSVLVLTAELFAYISASIFRRLLRKLHFSALLAGRNFEISLPLPAAIIFLASFAVSTFFPVSGVVFYSALNLAYILMPSAAIAGFKSVYLKGGLLSKRASGGSKGFFIAASIFLGICAPLTFLQFLSVFACVNIIAASIIAGIRKSKEENGN